MKSAAVINWEKEQEVRANGHMLVLLRYISVIFLFTWVLSAVGVFIIDLKMISVAVAATIVILNAPTIVCHFAGKEKKWVKFLLLGSLGLAITISGICLSFHIVLAYSLPVVYAAQYRSRKVIYETYVMMVVGLFVSAMGSYYFGLCDANMLILSNNLSSWYAEDFASGVLSHIQLNPNPWVTIPLYFVFPRALILLSFVPVTRYVVEERAANAVKMFEIKRDGETDKTTRFYNKSKYTEMIRDYYPRVEEIGVIFWDVNNLKKINDTYGHARGDWIISIIANCIYENTDNLRRVYRVGGDEFVMILENPEEGEVLKVIDDVQRMIEDRNTASRIKLSVAIGHASGPGKKVKEVIHEADLSMYHDKRHRGREVAEKGENFLHNRMFDAFAGISSHLYTYICDLGTHEFRCSENAVEYFGLSGEYIDDIMGEWVPRIHPDDAEIFREDIQKIFAGESRTHRFEYRVRNRYGEYTWLECKGRVIYDTRQDTNFFVGIMIRLDAKNKYDPLTKMKTVYEFNNIDFEGRHGAVLLIGIDDFRKVVNNYGYAYGDQVLSEFAGRITKYCGETFQPFRLEGDEFLILLPNGTGGDALELFRNMKSLGNGLGQKEGRLVNLKFSGGAVLYPEHASSRSEMISNLEHSLERAKAQNRGDLTFFSKEIANVHRHTLNVKESITSSIQNNFDGFQLYFQPIVDKDTNQIVSCEALLRYKFWEQLGIGIGEIVKMMEENGDIIPVGKWVVDTVFARMRVWQDKYPELRISFNVSAVQFREEDLVDYIIEKAKQSSILPERMIIELTESSEVTDIYSVQKSLTRLREYGFKIALDDFGIAYSTLLLIRELPADYVKIDHNFVRHLDTRENETDLAIIEAVIGLCEALHIQVIAEGVENAKILDVLDRFGINCYQGYYFSVPINEERFVALLERSESLPVEEEE